MQVVMGGIIGAQGDLPKTAFGVEVMLVDFVAGRGAFQLDPRAIGDAIVHFDGRREKDLRIGVNRLALISIIQIGQDDSRVEKVVCVPQPFGPRRRARQAGGQQLGAPSAPNSFACCVVCSYFSLNRLGGKTLSTTSRWL